MSEIEKIALREFMCILKDRNWHELYEFHEKYHLAPVLIFNSLETLLMMEIIIRDGKKIRLSETLDNKQLAMINQFQKTKRPEILNSFERKFLPSWQHRV